MKKPPLILVVLMLLLLVACDSGPVVPTPPTPPASDSLEPIPSVSEIDVLPIEPEPDTNASTPSIEETVLFDQDGIKITAMSLDAEAFFGYDLKLLVENNSSVGITVQARNTSVNGLMIEPMMSIDVQPGKKANESMTFMSSQLEENGIEAIGIIETGFHIFDTETWDTILDIENITIETSAAGAVQQAAPETRNVVFEQNGVIISFVDFDMEDFWGMGIKFYVENNGDQPITVQARDVSINGFMVDSIMSCDVLPGKMSNDSMTFFKTDLEENAIEEVESVEFKFHIFNKDTWDTIVDTDVITITPP